MMAETLLVVYLATAAVCFAWLSWVDLTVGAFAIRLTWGMKAFMALAWLPLTLLHLSRPVAK